MNVTLERQGNSGRNWKHLPVHASELPSNDTQGLVLTCNWETAPRTRTTQGTAEVRCLPVFQLEPARLTLGSSLRDVLHWQGFIVKHNRLLAGWRYVISAVLISGKNCQREFLSLWRGLEGTSYIVELEVNHEVVCVCHRIINLNEI